MTKVLDLGLQDLTGVFPKSKTERVTIGPIQLVKCTGDDTMCGLLQMAHTYDLNELYGENYGYRSGLNMSMVKHLTAKIERILGFVDTGNQPLVLDIGSNDGTSLGVYPEHFIRVGMDPTASKFRQYYKPGIHVIADFFSAVKFREHFPAKKASVVTSFSMFYDLERPQEFVNEIAQILDEQGIWVFEQSYMPLMLERNSFDTACHEHLEYYAFKQIDFMMSRAGLKVVDVEFNDVNGGSFSISAAKQSAVYPEFAGKLALLAQEKFLDELEPYHAFAGRVNQVCNDLKAFVRQAHSQGKKVAALGASTKGNVLLQYCGFTSKDVFAVAEVNPDKFGMFTPGTLIPIESDEKVIALADYLIVLPWHFKPFFMNKYAHIAHKLVFPLPQLQVGA